MKQNLHHRTRLRSMKIPVLFENDPRNIVNMEALVVIVKTWMGKRISNSAKDLSHLWNIPGLMLSNMFCATFEPILVALI